MISVGGGLSAVRTRLRFLTRAMVRPKFRMRARPDLALFPGPAAGDWTATGNHPRFVLESDRERLPAGVVHVEMELRASYRPGSHPWLFIALDDGDPGTHAIALPIADATGRMRATLFLP